MRPRGISTTVFAAIMAVLLVVPANAAPVLSLGSNANYALSGSLNFTSRCNTSPSTYNSTACGPPVPTAFAYIFDDSVCSSSNSSCYFSPSYFTTSPGTTVHWRNNGALAHTVTSCSTNNSPSPSSCPVMNSPSLPTFNSGAIPSGGEFSFLLSAPGTYSYFCQIHPWMRGTVDASGPGPISMPPGVPQINLDGSVDWTVVGLNSNVAVLNLDHKVTVSVTVGALTFEPVTESGSLDPFSVQLSTRVESPGPATDLVLSILRGYLAALTGRYYTGGPASSTVTIVSPTIVSPAVSLLSQASSDPKALYSIWWVNGPLANGSPVQVLTQYSSVQDAETLNLGGSLGSRRAWVVPSEFTETVSANSPPSQFSPSSTNNSTFTLSLRFSYDQAIDLLLKKTSEVSVITVSQSSYMPGQTLCGSGGCTTVQSPTTVVRRMEAHISLTLQLSSTNLPLTRRTTVRASFLSDLIDTAPWLPVALAGIGAGAVAGGAVWLVRRARKNNSILTPAPLPAPTPA